MSIHTIANMVLEVMNFIGISSKMTPHHNCISYTTISTTKISYTMCIIKGKCIHQKTNDCVLKNTTLAS